MPRRVVDCTTVPRVWPFHPKYLGLGFAVVFFALAVGLVLVETRAPPLDAPFWSAVRTLLAVLGGSGFTAWLSMTIYEYVSERGQERNWRRQFALDLVKEIYGPMHDEIVRYRNRLKEHITSFKWDAASFVRSKYLALMVSESTTQKAEQLSRLTGEYNRTFEPTYRALQSVVVETTREFLMRVGGVEQADLTTGAEARYILGATAPGYREGYDRFMRAVAAILEKRGISTDLGEFEKTLRENVLKRPEATALLELLKKIDESGQALLDEIRPRIRSPYEF